MTNKFVYIWRAYVFPTQKQDRQFFSMLLSAILIGLGWGEYLVQSGLHKVFPSVVIISGLIIIGFTIKELYDEGKFIVGQSKPEVEQ